MATVSGQVMIAWMVGLIRKCDGVFSSTGEVPRVGKGFGSNDDHHITYFQPKQADRL
jgi:hypothetical protein